MRAYQLHVRDSSGRFERTVTVAMESDASAMVCAATIHNDHGIEVWHGVRRVGVVNPDGSHRL